MIAISKHSLIAILVLACVIGLGAGTLRDPNFWRTADQRGDALLRQGRYEDAAKTYTDPLRQGVALYRAARFEASAQAFARVAGADGEVGAVGAFNEGNAYLMRGAYDKAITGYNRALALRPGWSRAEDNRALAIARRERVKAEGGEMGDQKIGADKIVFDLDAKRGGQDTEVEGGAPLSDSELNALWLRRVQTTPGDFLRAKFAYQAAQHEPTRAPEEPR